MKQARADTSNPRTIPFLYPIFWIGSPAEEEMMKYIREPMK
jgi:archaellum component FlaD/FlaE